MKRVLILILPIVIYAQTYKEVIKSIDESLLLKSAKQLELAAKLSYQAAKGKNMPSLDASLNAAYLNEAPAATFRLPPLFTPITTEVGTKKQFDGTLLLTYPLFTGFAVTASVDKAKFEQEKAHLKALDLKRNLYIQATTLYTSIIALNQTIKAQNEAKSAVTDAYKKAKGFYENGMLPLSDLYNIQAKRYAIEAEIVDSMSQKTQLLNQLAYLVNQPIQSNQPLTNNLQNLNNSAIIQTALKSREYILVLIQMLKIDQEETKLAKSKLFPTIGLSAAIKRRGDSLALNGDGHSNADQSFVAASLSWNLFNGFSNKHTIEATRYKTLADKMMLNDYKNRITTELNNAFLQLKATKAKLKSAQMEQKAANEYYKLTKGRFENQLASADELSRSIADLAATKAKIAALENQILNQHITILLLSGLDSFAQWLPTI